jgi:arylsulfatase A-like enzyme
VTGRVRRVALAGVPVALLIAVAALWFPAWQRRLPRELTVEEVVAQLPDTLEGAGDTPIRRGPIQPGDPLRGDGPRASIIAPPGARIRFPVSVPADAALRFSVGVEGGAEKTPRSSGVRFSVSVDGREAWARVIDPGATRHDRRWFDARVELAAHAGRTVDVVLGTDAARGDRPLRGVPGWTHVRVVRALRRERQLASRSAPNLVVLLVDTLRADGLGCYGAHPSPSPTLDRLAGEGLLFEQAVAQSSWTMPSMASLFTGLHPRSHGALGDLRHRRGDDVPGGEFLADDVVTWAELAARAGITTVGLSANPLVSRATNLAQGFETFVDFPWDPAGRNWTPAAEINRAFLRWLAPNRGYRFAASLHYMEPHDPYTPPAALRPAAPAGVRPNVAAGWIRDLANRVNWHAGPPAPPAEIEHLRRLYAGEIRAWDDALAGLLEGLDALGLRDSTVLVVTADHGEEFQEHGHLAHGAHLYEESIRVPLLIAGPGVARGRRREAAQGIDLLPTLASLLGVQAPPGLAGHDLRADHAAAPVISETARGIAPDGARIDVVSVRDGGWKLIRTPALDQFELYDLARDAGERENRYGRAPEGERLAALLAAWQAHVPRAPQVTDRDPALHEKLRALGYVQ